MLAVVVFVIILVARGVKVIRQAEVMIIERLGKYSRTLAPGLRLLVPIVEKPRTVAWIQPISAHGRAANVARFSERVDLRESVMDFPARVITRDNVFVQINGLLSQITDPVRAYGSTT